MSSRVISRPISSIGCRTLESNGCVRARQGRVVEADDRHVTGDRRPAARSAASAPTAMRSDATKTASMVGARARRRSIAARPPSSVKSAISTSSLPVRTRPPRAGRDSRRADRRRGPCPAVRRSSQPARRTPSSRCWTAMPAPLRLSTSTYALPELGGRPPTTNGTPRRAEGAPGAGRSHAAR